MQPSPPRGFIVVCLVLLLTAMIPTVSAAEVAFSLGIGQAVMVGEYMVVLVGIKGTLPYYDLYRGSRFVARLPLDSGGAPKYSYANVDITTTGLAAGGTGATGIISVR